MGGLEVTKCYHIASLLSPNLSGGEQRNLAGNFHTYLKSLRELKFMIHRALQVSAATLFTIPYHIYKVDLNPCVANTFNLLRSAAHRQPKNVYSSTRKLQSIHLEQYNKFLKEKLEVRTKPVTETLSKNKLPTLKRPPGKKEGSACYTKE